ncbi:TIGR03936 family radical SAM-associated protein [Clostridium sp. E02]|uniref:TIGR03936 family radical SAM-associated protein n=1 Tax=Clostridium sp. E02 TaxID=2487134 RepID=UPI000F54B795|nr:TIGR03936 family radical SAM-associated protein [Clostridium sp. E02]
MKIRIKFTKQGPIRFVGHLDVMRYFQKAIRRADIDIKYSEGFSPHQIMSFAAPLGVGLTSNGEYMDIEVNSMESCETLKNELKETMVEGVLITECHMLEERAKNAMSLVAAADYTVTFREEKELQDMEEYFRGLMEFFTQPTILITKKTKKGERELDLKQFIYELSVLDNRIFMKLSAGSVNNIKPELVLDAYDQWRGITSSEFTFCIQREEIYGNTGDEEKSVLVPLGLIGESIE